MTQIVILFGLRKLKKYFRVIFRLLNLSPIQRERHKNSSQNSKKNIFFRDRPAAIRIDVRGLTDTSNFDEFPPIESTNETVDQTPSDKDWVFINYTYKRFEGLTQRGKKRS